MANRLPPVPQNKISEDLLWRNWFYTLFNYLTLPSTATSATTGSAGALPVAPAGYMIVVINGTEYKVPYYN